jgi:hypothetical protein
MVRAIAAVAAGLIVWTLIATLGNLVMRFAWPSYAAVEAAMRFTLEMMLARLLLGALSSLGAGWLAARISRQNAGAIYALAAVLIAIFIPVHCGLWEKFPLWYHAVFFASLAVMTVLGARLNGRKRQNGGSAAAAQDRAV